MNLKTILLRERRQMDGTDIRLGTVEEKVSELNDLAIKAKAGKEKK